MADECRTHGRFTNTRFIFLICFLLIGVLAYGITSFSQQPSGGDRAERTRSMSRGAEERGLAEPFKGITTDGNVVTGLFPVRSTGVSTAPVRQAGEEDAERIARVDFAGARDEGVMNAELIAESYRKELGLPYRELLSYLRENICYELDEDMRAGLDLYYNLAHRHGLAESARPLKFVGVGAEVVTLKQSAANATRMENRKDA